MWLTRFLVVRTCGHLEQVAYETARAYVDAKSGGLVRAFASSWLVKTRNPTPENLLDLAARFGRSLGERLGELLEKDDQHLHREISFLVDRRNKIAHGLSEGLSAAKALALENDADIVGGWLIENFHP